MNPHTLSRFLIAALVTALTTGFLVAAAPNASSAAPEQSLANLQAAYNGESNAHARYLAFAKKAEEDGYAGTAALFRAAARAECIHAENHAKVIRKLGAEPA